MGLKQCASSAMAAGTTLNHFMRTENEGRLVVITVVSTCPLRTVKSQNLTNERRQTFLQCYCCSSLHFIKTDHMRTEIRNNTNGILHVGFQPFERSFQL